MSDDQFNTAVKALVEGITVDDQRAIAVGLDAIPIDELIVEPEPTDYVAPDYLQKTAPCLAEEFGELLRMLRELNTKFAGERTVEAQATLSLTGEHEWLEEEFRSWCEKYFKIRGGLDRLSPQNGNDPWRLYLKCYEEFHRLLENRIVKLGTVNSSVLNLSQRYMLSAFAAQVLIPDLQSYAKTGRDRYGNATHRFQAKHVVDAYSRGFNAFDAFLRQVAQHLPVAYVPRDGPEWVANVRTRVMQLAEDLAFLRNIICVLPIDDAEKRQLHPNLWAQFGWDVYHGRSVGAVFTSSIPQPSTDRTTDHLLGIRRDGWLCHREFSWVRVDPDYRLDERRSELAVNWYVLDTLTAPLYEAWYRLDPDSAVKRGLEVDAPEQVRTAALAIAVAELDSAENNSLRGSQRRLPALRLKRICAILTESFGCTWSMAKGSEQKVYRPGYKQFTFGCHGSDRVVHVEQLKKCLRRLGILVNEFITACK